MPTPELKDHADWAFLNCFSVEQLQLDGPYDWSGSGLWAGFARTAIEQLRADLAEQVKVWNERLQPLGGDPCIHDWRAFRPLRLSREEDWSDWLGHLLQTSRSGRLAKLVLGTHVANNHALPSVAREESTEDAARRLDLLISWASGEMTHVEVKLWDESFAKTFETSAKARAENASATSWSDFIVLPDESVGDWLEVQTQFASSGLAIKHVTWADLAVALRRCLLSEDESVVWRVWAASFCGAVEQQLLGHVRFTAGGDSADLADAAILKRQTDLLRRALTDE